jgi:polyphenol oxidase
VTLGRVVIPAPLPDGFALFYTTADFDGHGDGLKPVLHFLRERFGIDARLETCSQVHGKRVGRASARPQECDALFTAERGVALGIKVADCLPVTLCDPVHRVIANVHSGWRGAAQRITAETLDALARETAFAPAEAYAYLGPSIRVCCFEVGEEVATQFDDRFVDRSRGTKPHLDLVHLTDALLRERGVSRVVDTGLCTRCGDEPRFHSYRRDKRSGRNLAIAAQ